MKVYKFTVFLYLLFSIFFAYEAYDAYQHKGDYIIRLAFAAVALFMFFFRLRNLKKLENNKTTPKQ